MQRHVLMMAAVLAVAPVWADTALDSCPLLPAGSGLVWTYEAGGDFGVCYAAPAGSRATVIGVYIGNEPGFDIARATPVGSGNVGGRQVVWYRKDSASGADTLALQTVVVVSSRYIAHVWVNADTQAQLQDRLSVLQLIGFRR